MPVIPVPSSLPGPGTCAWDVNPTCAAWETYTPDQQDAALQVATAVLWSATGRQFGACEVTIRPCQSRSEVERYRVWPARWGGQADGGGWGPYLFAGVWRNCGCGTGCCCRARCEITLPGPVSAITEIRVDGDLVDEGAYRVDVQAGEFRLVRMDGECWPTCQDFDVDAPDPGSFTVSYTRGTPTPGALLLGAGTLACELAKGQAEGDCALPKNITQLTRQGVTVDFLDQQLSSPINGRLTNIVQTGIYEVDLLIRTYNPYGLTARPVVLSVDDPDIGDRSTVWRA